MVARSAGRERALREPSASKIPARKPRHQSRLGKDRPARSDARDLLESRAWLRPRSAIAPRAARHGKPERARWRPPMPLPRNSRARRQRLRDRPWPGGTGNRLRRRHRDARGRTGQGDRRHGSARADIRGDSRRLGGAVALIHPVPTSLVAGVRCGRCERPDLALVTCLNPRRVSKRCSSLAISSVPSSSWTRNAGLSVIHLSSTVVTA